VSTLPSVTWVDVSELIGWRGHLTGIQRVVYEYARRIVADPARDVRGFTFDFAIGDLVEVDIAGLLDAMSTEVAPAAAPTGPPSATLAPRMLALAKDVYDRLPADVRGRIRDRDIQRVLAAGRLAFRVADRTARIAQSARRRPAALPPDPQRATFLTGDTVLLMGRAWENPQGFDLIAARKTEEDFRLVTLIYDVVPLIHPEFFGPGLYERYANFVFEALDSSDVLPCISQSTERDLLAAARELNFEPPTTSVIELGDPQRSDVAREQPRFVDDGEPFILAIGSIEGRKNHQLLYQAWNLARERGIELPRLICVGSPGWLGNDVQYAVLNDPSVRGRMTLHHGVPDSEVAWLLEHCLFTVFPSVYEGWGLPIAESLAAGKACAASRSSSMPEVGGDLVEYFSPYSADELLAAVTSLLDADTRRAREERIAHDYQARSWEQSYSRLRALL